MAPTPYSTTHQIDIVYSFSGFTHRYQIPVNAELVGTVYNLHRETMSDYLWTDAVDDFVALFKALFASTANIGFAVLQEYVAGSFVPVESYTVGVNGTHAGSNTVASQVTTVFRDTAFKFARSIALESVYVPPLKVAYPSTDASLDAFIGDLLPSASSANPLWEWVRSRGDRPYSTATFITLTFNRRLRRARGVG